MRGYGESSYYFSFILMRMGVLILGLFIRPSPHFSHSPPSHLPPPSRSQWIKINNREELSKLTTTYPHNRNRNTGSGSRWQIGGAFAVDAGGFVRWSRPATSADDVPDFGEALRALGGHWGMAP